MSPYEYWIKILHEEVEKAGKRTLALAVLADKLGDSPIVDALKEVCDDQLSSRNKLVAAMSASRQAETEASKQLREALSRSDAYVNAQTKILTEAFGKINRDVEERAKALRKLLEIPEEFVVKLNGVLGSIRLDPIKLPKIDLDPINLPNSIKFPLDNK